MIGLLRRIAGGGRGLFVERPLTGPLWAVGDVHGCLSLYREIEARVADEARETGVGQTLVILGDIIDRGPEVRGVVDHMMAPAPEGVSRVCLMGNHEDMALRFLSDPSSAVDWLRFGAWPTLGAYGIVPDPVQGARGPDVVRIARELKAAMGPGVIGWLKSLPLGLIAGPYVLAHAGVAPEVPLARQTRADLIWTRHGEIADLLPPADLGERLVIHGHVPVEAAVRQGWRLNIDTGAFATGRLTAVRLVPGEEPRFVVTGRA
jgi:serine/threonine protein phosphatase 1